MPRQQLVNLYMYLSSLSLHDYSFVFIAHCSAFIFAAHLLLLMSICAFQRQSLPASLGNVREL